MPGSWQNNRTGSTAPPSSIAQDHRHAGLRFASLFFGAVWGKGFDFRNDVGDARLGERQSRTDAQEAGAWAVARDHERRESRCGSVSHIKQYADARID